MKLVMNVVTCTECFFSPQVCFLMAVFFDGDAHLIGTIFVKVCFISAVIWLNYLCLISKWCAFLTWLDKSPWTIKFCMSFVCKSACVLIVFSIWGKWSSWIWIGVTSFNKFNFFTSISHKSIIDHPLILAYLHVHSNVFLSLFWQKHKL